MGWFRGGLARSSFCRRAVTMTSVLGIHVKVSGFTVEVGTL
ncbi:hypothetical protein HMPREF9622_01274 [Cutibacterium modestum HL037PA3]|uniref:Uncharacterized protein n=1 Tax=Cutibacterium modestum HL044PA1 TaxID=765109 RepID=A0ABN0C7S8_9ACTN|nr:hypothetical protein HMPREF9621_00885 [Cutibacterium modestum HL037PA2]EFS93346.1 hypothetical protein HMPREF9607_00559 [Cutibacterium modestum HL044PA1]EFT15657.1 hypothetical protein HMPREF9622_01274 [Cutibacterium modestum HL037PA3]